MNLVLGSPQLLAGLALTAGPVLVHLLARTRPAVREFPSLQLIRHVMCRTLRVRRPHDWLLLAVRTLAIAALAAAFVRPVFFGATPLAAAGEKKTVVIVLDRSASMAATEGAQSRFGTAAARAIQLLESSGASTAANVVWIDAQPAGLFAEPGPNRGFLIDALKRAAAVPQPGAAETALRLAFEQLRDAEGAREVLILSDFQSTAWKTVSLEPPPGVRLVTMPVGSSDLPNMTLTDFRAQPASPVTGQPMQLHCRVRNFSPEPRRIVVFFEAGEARHQRAVDIPAWSDAEAAVSVPAGAPGDVPLRAALADDAFPADDAAHSMARVRESVRLAVAAPATSPWIEPLTALGGAIPWLSARRIEPAEALATGTDVLFVAGWDGQNAAAFRNLAARGTAVILAPRDATPAAAIDEALGLPASQGAPPLAAEASPDRPWKVSLSAEAHPAVALFRTGEFGNPFAGSFRERLRWPAPAAPATVIASHSDGVPALVVAPPPTDSKTAAPLFLWNLALAPGASTWPQEPAFVAFFGELCRTSLPPAAGSTGETLPGRPYQLVPGPQIDPHDLRLLAADGSTLEITPPSLPGGPFLGPPAVPGACRWMARDTVVQHAWCNFPEPESDLRRLDPATLARTAGDAAPSRASLAAERDGWPLWPWLALAGILLLWLESAIAAFGGKSSAPPAPAVS